jgi:hypothetical protein
MLPFGYLRFVLIGNKSKASEKLKTNPEASNK